MVLGSHLSTLFIEACRAVLRYDAAYRGNAGPTLLYSDMVAKSLAAITAFDACVNDLPEQERVIARAKVEATGLSETLALFDVALVEAQARRRRAYLAAQRGN